MAVNALAASVSATFQANGSTSLDSDVLLEFTEFFAMQYLLGDYAFTPHSSGEGRSLGDLPVMVIIDNDASVITRWLYVGWADNAMSGAVTVSEEIMRRPHFIEQPFPRIFKVTRY